jgi:cytochrome bd-type quinol oxidase subunit 2
MDMWFDHITLSRVQFAFTAMFHILWPVLTVGLSLFLVVIEALWLKTHDAQYYHHTRFWSRLLLLNFGIGMLLPVMIIYNGYQYLVFRGKVEDGATAGNSRALCQSDTRVSYRRYDRPRLRLP